MLKDIYQRYGKTLFIAETGAEGGARAAWLHYVCDEVRLALAADVPVASVCLYPVTDYPGWEDNRHCEVGLVGMPDSHGHRPVHTTLAAELARQQVLMNPWTAVNASTYADVQPALPRSSTR